MSSGRDQTRAISIASAGILLSRALGYVRDVVITAVFGVGSVTDAYLVAFLIPNFFRRLAGEGALAASFVPIFAAKDRDDRDEAERFTGATICYVSVAVACVCVLAACVPGVFVTVFAPGLRQTPEIFHLASELLAVLFPYLLMMSVFAVLGGALNARGNFGAPAGASAMENVCVIAAALLLVPMIAGGPERRIWGLVAGVLVGGVMQVGVVWLALKRTGFRFKPSFKRTPELSEMLLLMFPAAVTQVVYQLNNVINQLIASFLTSGSITALYLAYRVIEFPAALFGTSVGTVTLPKAAQAASDHEFQDIMGRSVRMCLMWLIPSTTAFIVFAGPLTGLMFQYGNVSGDMAESVANVLRVYALALPFIGLSRILSSACFAVKSPRLPLRSGAAAVLTNAAFSTAFVMILPDAYKACGIALGMGLASAVNFFTLSKMIRWHVSFRGFVFERSGRCVVRYLACSCVFVAALALSRPFILSGDMARQKIGVAAAVILSVGIYFGALMVVRRASKDPEC